MTGEALEELIDALLPGLLTIIAVLGITTVVGGAIGPVVGALVGAGVGAALGAVAGVQLGLSIAGTLLIWIGLGFLLVAIGEGLGELSALAKRLNPADPRNPVAKGAQEAFRDRFEEMVSSRIKDSLRAANPIQLCVPLRSKQRPQRVPRS